MITIQEVQAKVKEIFPKLHEGCRFIYQDNIVSGYMTLVVRSEKDKDSDLKIGILISELFTERELLKRLDELINYTHKIYWG